MARTRVAKRQQERNDALKRTKEDFAADDNPRKPSNLGEWAQRNDPEFVNADNAWVSAIRELQIWEDKVFAFGKAALRKANQDLQTAVAGLTVVRG